MTVHDKSGKELKVGQLVDLHILQPATGLVVDVKHSPLEVPGQGVMPACVTIQVTLTIPAGREGGVWCYVIKDPPERQENEPVIEESASEESVAVESNVTPFTKVK